MSKYCAEKKQIFLKRNPTILTKYWKLFALCYSSVFKLNYLQNSLSMVIYWYWQLLNLFALSDILNPTLLKREIKLKLRRMKNKNFRAWKEKLLRRVRCQRVHVRRAQCQQLQVFPSYAQWVGRNKECSALGVERGEVGPTSLGGQLAREARRRFTLTTRPEHSASFTRDEIGSTASCQCKPTLKHWATNWMQFHSSYQ